MNKWWILVFACLSWVVITPFCIGICYGWDITTPELPFPIQILEVVTLLLGSIGFMIFFSAAIMEEKYP